MQAYAINRFGSSKEFANCEIPDPSIREGHVIVAVKATSVNPIDCKIRSGKVPHIAPEFPAVLHGDIAGTIVKVGKGVDRFHEGDEIYACAGGLKGLGGALSQFILIDAACIAKKPATLSFSQAAALPLVAITAWTALFRRTNIQANQYVLIHGGLGGVGHVAVQLARHAGAKVATTVSSDYDFNTAKKLGAQFVINYKDERVEDYVQRITQGNGFAAVFDTVGGENIKKSFQAAALNGVISTTLANTTLDLTPAYQKGLSLHVIFMLLPLLYRKIDRSHQGLILEKVAQLVDQGKLEPLIDNRSFTIDQIADAHAYFESGQAKGKVVVNWNV